jgi:aerobic-type carbon monoxide dehydrogenase small subunit (CoxS/CutS family)
LVVIGQASSTPARRCSTRLREHLHLTGTKKGCDHGQCGACTVIVEGPADQFLPDAGRDARGRRITTIEGLGTPDNLHPMQAAFIKHDGYQCGYCTPGQICSAVAVLDEIKAGIPSHVSADLVGGPAAQRGRDPRADERQYLPLRRLFEHHRGDDRSRGDCGMKPSPTNAQTRPPRQPRRRPHAGAKFIAGGTNLLDLMKLQIETPAHLSTSTD